MRALVLVEYGRLEVREVPDPEPRDGWAILRVLATGICGSDIHGFTGENGRRFPGQVMGHESIGRLTAPVGGMSAGDLVTFNPVVGGPHASRYAGREQHDPGKWVIGVDPTHHAAFAEYVAVPRDNLVPVAPDLPPALGTLIEPLAVAVNGVGRAGDVRGQWVLVLGGGPIGQGVALAAMRAGASVIVSEPDAARRDLCVRLGALVIDPNEGAVVDQVTRRGHDVTVAIDAVGSSATLADALAVTPPGSTIVLVGMASPEIRMDAYRVSVGERSVVGAFTYSASSFRDAARWVSEGDRAIFDGLITDVVRPEEAQSAFEALAGGTGSAGKTVVDFD